MASVYAERAQPGDEDNTAFGLPERLQQRKPGYVRAIAPAEGEPGDERRRPSDGKDIPQESLAARMAKN